MTNKEMERKIVEIVFHNPDDEFDFLGSEGRDKILEKAMKDFPDNETIAYMAAAAASVTLNNRLSFKKGKEALMSMCKGAIANSFVGGSLFSLMLYGAWQPTMSEDIFVGISSVHPYIYLIAAALPFGFLIRNYFFYRKLSK
jgi:hypothetical protein